MSINKNDENAKIYETFLGDFQTLWQEEDEKPRDFFLQMVLVFWLVSGPAIVFL